MVATTLKMNRKPLNRNAAITQEIRISAKLWWDAVAPQCEQFFFLSASFNGTQSDLHRERLLAKMDDCLNRVRRTPHDKPIKSLRRDLLSAMSNLQESLEATLLDDAPRSTERLHASLLDLQHFHVLMERLGLQYSSIVPLRH